MATKTICLVHGVGLHIDLQDVINFGDRLKQRLDIQYVAYRWQHPGTFPPDPRKTKLMFGTLRDFTWEVIMDFAYAIREFDTHAGLLPQADFYIGHSAGGVLAMARPTKPCAIMGCPLQLLEPIKPMLALRATTANVLNILHARDPIASPMLGGTNMYYDNNSCYEYVNPIAAHTQYWHSRTPVNMIVDWYKKTVNGDE